MANVNPTFLVITINVSESNIPIKRQRLAECIKKKGKYDLTVHCLQEIHFRYRDKWSVKGCEKTVHTNGN